MDFLSANSGFAVKNNGTNLPRIKRENCTNVFFSLNRDIDHPNEDLGVLYANDVKEIIEKMEAEGKKPSAFIAESLQSCGGN
jgi:hypothetical protein